MFAPAISSEVVEVDVTYDEFVDARLAALTRYAYVLTGDTSG
jgi:hypothetical protein